jgi:hypothetical protein
MIQFTCPCGKALHAQDDHAGQTTRCPACGRDLDIPGGEGVQTADAPRAAGRPPDEAVQGRPDRPGAGREDWPRAPTTSGKAISSVILGVLSLMLCSVFTGLPAIILGAFGLRDIGRSQGRVGGKGLAIAGIVTGSLSFLCVPVLVALLLPAVQKVREAAARMQSSNNLKQIVLAMHDINSANGTFPPAAICDSKGKPLLSWRVAILPYIEQQNLYTQFKLDEPWDGPNNSKLLSRMPKEYAFPGDPAPQAGNTHYRVFVGNGAAFEWCKGARMPQDFPDGTSNTILVVEAATAVPWTKPEELDYDPDSALPALGGHFSGGFQAALVDGSVRMIAKDVSQQTLKAAITRNGGDVLGPDW